ncbi:hypothetical protein C3Y87_03455 [Carbonactinospora thermoautotrophica]|uniref:Xaa-Pro dipeptidyl-peptidase C-terminal domain-containing protein n=1 Tax=Carbonactinospora thermoautotrophica TaxID=1469144 RepID=A0A132N126_9ACTN|nr:CocE/NonD family hydrolase C-terminal non-catalytic domain-containing protein [Carbonactinospora thermoautotrophica]KWX03706.1 hypothetical protein TH66_12965 [Carbonactinospora thermoautotrophica]KWX10897.1 hypothetical protein TR74_00905 [Carbonactinospora thermoautotrophica]MCX9190486.1 hypothetical protein [Carbonactinospora thermoautotrophica]
MYRDRTATTPPGIVTRGWLDVRNHHSASVTEPVEPGHTYPFRWKRADQTRADPTGPTGARAARTGACLRRAGAAGRMTRTQETA